MTRHSKDRGVQTENRDRLFRLSGEARFRNVVDRSADGILVIDQEGTVRFANPAAGAIFGRTREALVGEHFGFPVTAGEKAEVDAIGESGEPVTVAMRVARTRWEGELCRVVSLRDITDRKQAEERIAHLNSVLQAVRGVGRLIVRERDRDRLLQGICDTLVARGYHSAWISLLDHDGDQVTATGAGAREDLDPLFARLARGGTVSCVRQALDKPQVLVIEEPSRSCGDCPLAESCGDRGAMSVRLEHDGEAYGVLTVSTITAFIVDKEEHALLREMADDIAFALHKMSLERQREELERIVSRSPAVAFLWGAEEGYPVEYVSDNVDQFGYVPDDFYSGRIGLADVVHPDDLDRFAARVAEADRSQSNQLTQEYRVVTASGEIRWVDDRTWIRRDSAGAAVHYEGIVLDITERKEAAAELRRSARLNELLLDSLPHPAMLIRGDRVILAANRAAREAGAKIGHYCWREFGQSQFISEEDRRQLEECGPDGVKCTFCLADEALANGQPRNIPELKAFGRLWDTWWVPINGETYLHYAVDITDYKRMEEALRHSEQQLDQTLQTMVDGTVRVNQKGEIIYANPAAERILEVRLDDILGRYYCEREWRQIDEAGDPYPPERLPLAVALEQQREVRGLEHGIEAPSGERKWLSVNAAPLLDEDGRLYGAVASFRDVTEAKRAQKQIERYAAELERSNQDLQQFGYVISHDLREPLRVVSGYLRLLEQRYRGELDRKADAFIDYAVDGAERMQQMIGALLDLSRVETRGEAFAPTDVDAVVEQVLPALSRAMEECGAEVTRDPLPMVMADEAQLGQVFQNLVANALKFRQEGVPPRIHISAEREGCEWTISVADNGIGIEPEQAERIFTIFQRLHTEEEYPGLGIGLALCKRIVERHGGRIWVESEPGEGTTFYFTLPAYDEQGAPDDEG